MQSNYYEKLTVMTIQEIQTRKEDQTFDCKSIQIEPKALAIPIVAFANADGASTYWDIANCHQTILEKTAIL